MKYKKLYVCVDAEHYNFLVTKSKEYGITVSALINVALSEYMYKHKIN